ncbi:hypothetical protein C0J52_18043 [Blattella germanica]|nr:hypothetical protein C0J52_18043 [Blattella germanica]
MMEEYDILPVFINSSGEPYQFYIHDFSEKKRIAKLIKWCHGVVEEDSGGEYTLQLASPYFKVGNDEVFSIEYVIDCCARKKTLNIKNYRLNKTSQYNDDFNPMDVLKRRLSWSEAEKFRKTLNPTKEIGIIPPELFSPDDVPEERNVFKRYSRSEQKAIVNFIIRKKAHHYVRGNRFWIVMEKKQLCKGRTWQSLKEHFLKKILPNIKLFISSEDEISKFEDLCYRKQSERGSECITEELESNARDRRESEREVECITEELKNKEIEVEENQSEDSESNDNNSENEENGKNENRKRMPFKRKINFYSTAEDDALLNFISKRGRWRANGGTKIWKLMERKKVLPGRTWQSMKERYRKVLVDKLEEYLQKNEKLQNSHVKVRKADSLKRSKKKAFGRGPKRKLFYQRSLESQSSDDDTTWSKLKQFKLQEKKRNDKDKESNSNLDFADNTNNGANRDQTSRKDMTVNANGKEGHIDSRSNKAESGNKNKNVTNDDKKVSKCSVLLSSNIDKRNSVGCIKRQNTQNLNAVKNTNIGKNNGNLIEARIKTVSKSKNNLASKENNTIENKRDIQNTDSVVGQRISHTDFEKDSSDTDMTSVEIGENNGNNPKGKKVLNCIEHHGEILENSDSQKDIRTKSTMLTMDNIRSTNGEEREIENYDLTIDSSFETEIHMIKNNERNKEKDNIQNGVCCDRNTENCSAEQDSSIEKEMNTTERIETCTNEEMCNKIQNIQYCEKSINSDDLEIDTTIETDINVENIGNNIEEDLDENKVDNSNRRTERNANAIETQSDSENISRHKLFLSESLLNKSNENNLDLQFKKSRMLHSRSVNEKITDALKNNDKTKETLIIKKDQLCSEILKNGESNINLLLSEFCKTYEDELANTQLKSCIEKLCEDVNLLSDNNFEILDIQEEGNSSDVMGLSDRNKNVIENNSLYSGNDVAPFLSDHFHMNVNNGPSQFPANELISKRMNIDNSICKLFVSDALAANGQDNNVLTSQNSVITVLKEGVNSGREVEHDKWRNFLFLPSNSGQVHKCEFVKQNEIPLGVKQKTIKQVEILEDTQQPSNNMFLNQGQEVIQDVQEESIHSCTSLIKEQDFLKNIQKLPYGEIVKYQTQRTPEEVQGGPSNEGVSVFESIEQNIRQDEREEEETLKVIQQPSKGNDVTCKFIKQGKMIKSNSQEPSNGNVVHVLESRGESSNCVERRFFESVDKINNSIQELPLVTLKSFKQLEEIQGNVNGVCKLPPGIKLLGHIKIVNNEPQNGAHNFASKYSLKNPNFKDRNICNIFRPTTHNMVISDCVNGAEILMRNAVNINRGFSSNTSNSTANMSKSILLKQKPNSTSNVSRSLLLNQKPKNEKLYDIYMSNDHNTVDEVLCRIPVLLLDNEDLADTQNNMFIKALAPKTNIKSSNLRSLPPSGDKKDQIIPFSQAPNGNVMQKRAVTPRTSTQSGDLPACSPIGRKCKGQKFPQTSYLRDFPIIRKRGFYTACYNKQKNKLKLTSVLRKIDIEPLRKGLMSFTKLQPFSSVNCSSNNNCIEEHSSSNSRLEVGKKQMNDKHMLISESSGNVDFQTADHNYCSLAAATASVNRIQSSNNNHNFNSKSLGTFDSPDTEVKKKTNNEECCICESLEHQGFEHDYSRKHCLHK